MEGYGNENPGAFQPTRPLRGATRPASSGSACRSNFNPRAPCGARPVWIRIEIAIHDFNPRAPCGARRTPRATSLTRTTNFNPRAPCGARPRARFPLSIFLLISTHAPLAGRDRWIGNKKNKRINFNPRAPCGARQGMQYPLRGANYISTHAPLAGRDPRRQTGVRQAQEISTHAPLAGRDSKSVQITMHIFAITDKFQMLLHRMPPVRAFCSFLMQENHADFGCEPPK